MTTLSVRRAVDRPPLNRATLTAVAGVGACVIVALLLFTRFGLNGLLSRDEGIYVYGGEQLALHGTPPYESIFDPKAPLATLLCALGSAVARVLGVDALPVVRIEFLILSVLTVLAVYQLVLRLWGSHLGALAAGVVMASFFPFAVDALAGPDAKAPGVLFLVLTMWFAAGRRWAWSAAAGSLAFLVWQPFIVYPLVTLVAALCLGDGPGERRGPHWRAFGRGLLAALVPVAAVAIYFAASGAMGVFLESAVRFPLTGIKRGPYEFASHVRHVRWVAERFAGPLFWIGLVLFVGLVVHAVVVGRGPGRRWLSNPLIYIVAPTLLLQGIYALYDFQWYPDLFPLLAYPAIGIGGAVALARRWAGSVSLVGATGAIAVVAAAAAALTGYQWVQFGHSDEIGGLVAERRMVCVLNSVVGPGQLVSLGNPAPLAIAERTNPDRFIYLDSGVGDWKVAHTPGGVVGWAREIRQIGPRVIIDDGWTRTSEVRRHLIALLREQGYKSRHIGQWHVLVPREVVDYARRNGLDLTRAPASLAAQVCDAKA